MSSNEALQTMRAATSKLQAIKSRISDPNSIYDPATPSAIALPENPELALDVADEITAFAKFVDDWATAISL